MWRRPSGLRGRAAGEARFIAGMILPHRASCTNIRIRSASVTVVENSDGPGSLPMKQRSFRNVIPLSIVFVPVTCTSRALVASLDHADTRAAVSAERAVLADIGGGCSLPLGVHASRADDTWEIRATLFAPQGPDRLDEHGTGPEALELARRLARALISRGARNLRPSTPS